jgi:2'-5' RNA ligase
MRLFIGIPLAPEVAGELAALTARLKSASDGLRWSAPEGWHITLQFLGKTSEEQYACVAAGLRTIRYAAFEIQLERPGFFERSGVFFAGVRVSPALTGLQHVVIAVTKLCGFVPEDRPYHPHITLARDKGRGGWGVRKMFSRAPKDVQFSGFAAQEYLLYESFPEPGGSRYEVRERFALTRA